MIEHLLPPGAFSRAAYGGELDEAPLYPEEEPVVARAVAKRRREYAAGRACAREALARLGVPAGPILRDAHRGAPHWPDGVVGSITHCDGYRAAAVARSTDILALGIDAEPHDRLPAGVLDSIVATDAERAALAALAESDPRIHWDRLFFSAKETVYKAWYPYHHRMLGFHEAELLFTADPDTPDAVAGGERDTPDRGGYTARVLVPGPLLAEGIGPEVFTGRWIVRDGLLVTAIVVPAHGNGGPAA
ncbi:4'-phosphopantetheinyl transferase family protein [Actinacidiphila paucisporea]|uniref:4'-phosphopantetheinyl transferase EntD (Siderophore biosynthesis) n=1 Tax=Actinacidiphila paucisporea TaxID=310782 RepID=A0A1M7AM18_9ACTN|nr:4'-phosphopantetheinyl transferase superfamily protein [Actinacidiphila paucisporea]SHL43804.1 4'-phosphopantetheinyl transferase EntD (siderophore biosynthesis) [Actinacidiphila paucisporea]